MDILDDNNAILDDNPEQKVKSEKKKHTGLTDDTYEIYLFLEGEYGGLTLGLQRGTKAGMTSL